MTSKYEEAVIRLRAAMFERHAAEIAAINGLYERMGVPLPDKKFDFPPMSEKPWTREAEERVLMTAIEWFESVRVTGLGSARWALVEHALYQALKVMLNVPFSEGPDEKATTEGGRATE